jgi:hypothetical protein
MNDKSTSSQFLDTLIKYVPLILAVLSFLSYSNLHYYYREFGITIYEYLGISELLLLFLPSLHSFVSLTIWTIIIVSITFAAFPVKKEEPEEDEETRTVWEYFSYLRPAFIKRIGLIKTLGVFKKILFRLWPLYTIILLLIILEKGDQSDWITSCTENIQDDGVFWVFFTVLLILATVILRTQMTMQIKSIVLFCLCAYGVLWMIKHRNSCHIDRLKAGESTQEVSIVLDTKTLTTSADTIYIGSVQNYSFLYILSRDRTLVIPKDDILLFEIENK